MTGRGRSSRTAIVKRPPNSKPRCRRGGCGRHDASHLVHGSSYELILRTVRSIHSCAPAGSRNSKRRPGSSYRQPRLGNLFGQRNRGRGFPSVRPERQRGLHGQLDPGFVQLHSLQPPVHILCRPNRFRIGPCVGSLLFPHPLFLKKPATEDDPEFPRTPREPIPISPKRYTQAWWLPSHLSPRRLSPLRRQSLATGIETRPKSWLSS